MSSTEIIEGQGVRFIRHRTSGINSGVVVMEKRSGHSLEASFRALYKTVVQYIRSQAYIQISTASPYDVLTGQVMRQTPSVPGPFTCEHEPVLTEGPHTVCKFDSVSQKLEVLTKDGNILVPMADVLKLVAEEMKHRMRTQLEIMDDNGLLSGFFPPKLPA